MSENPSKKMSVCGEESSCCRPAVQRAYTELRRCGQPERYAFEAALAVYRYHHPGTMPRQAELTVAEWVWDGVMH
ncbi:hypothetical protein JL100_019425 [Skermanella mucosa]|uniref:hypothetical protein n=1 Tax=Skermanella mucosa TaxID=1789672 RepID=UPI00192B71D3|nr:hypothetical protein [Skermanella mucosa]UEM19254.1 hypothetical protein JL100_019425 [Skermanella mucosa]